MFENNQIAIALLFNIFGYPILAKALARLAYL